MTQQLLLPKNARIGGASKSGKGYDLHGVYSGPVAVLKGREAMIRPLKSGPGWVAQFDRHHLVYRKRALAFGWHRFKATDFGKEPLLKLLEIFIEENFYAHMEHGWNEEEARLKAKDDFFAQKDYVGKCSHCGRHRLCLTGGGAVRSCEKCLWCPELEEYLSESYFRL